MGLENMRFEVGKDGVVNLVVEFGFHQFSVDAQCDAGLHPVLVIRDLVDEADVSTQSRPPIPGDRAVVLRFRKLENAKHLLLKVQALVRMMTPKGEF
jgi:hypothetical protein